MIPKPEPAAAEPDRPAPGGAPRNPAVDTLARTLYGEARGELVRGKEAVAAVVMNRVRRAVAGTLKDPTAGATHYHANGLTPPWARDRGPSAVIGGHKFYNDVE